MNCRACKHPLWRVSGRECPGCGLAFRPSDFRFRPGTVRFCCPHCGQGYLGAGASGHPDPRRFECVYCGEWIDSDEMLLEPADDIEEHETRPPENPWLEGHRPIWARLAIVWAMALARPATLLARTPPDSPLSSTLRFAAVTHALLGGAFLLAAVLAVPCLGLPGPPGGPAQRLGFWAARAAIVLAGTAVLGSLWALATHALLRRRPGAAPLARTLQSIAYTCAPNTLWLAPVGGNVAGAVGVAIWAVSAGRAIGAAHQIGAGRAARATLLPLGAFAAVALLAVLAAGPLAWWNAPGPAWTVSPEQRVSVFADHLRRAVREGDPPAHGAQLLLREGLPATSMLVPGSATSPDQAGIGHSTFAEFALMSRGRRLAVIQQAADALPGAAPAHRVGDFVFVLDAVAVAGEHPGLWAVVESWDPAANPSAGRDAHVLHNDLTLRTIPLASLGEALDEQNRLRAGAGLPAIPDPRDVRWEAPGG